VIEPEDKPQSLVEIALRLLRLCSDWMMQIAQAFKEWPGQGLSASRHRRQRNANNEKRDEQFHSIL
jgi:hypothetical protein